MNRKYVHGLLLLLLALLPAGLLAQSVTGIQYWFDNGSRHSRSLSSGESTLNLDTDELSVGMHTLYYRFIQSGGDIVWDEDITDVTTEEVTHEHIYYADVEYSPVYSARFFKHDPTEGRKVEYWFDNKPKATTTITGDENETVSLDLTNTSQFPLGFHQLNMRFSTPGKSPSAIYTADVMKFSAGSDYLEYWVDNDYEHSKKLETGAGNASVYVTTAMPLDLSEVTPGLHHLYYRLSNSEGVAGSAVYSAMIFRHANEASQIEYWFDDDAESVTKKQFAEQYQNGATYTLDLTDSKFDQGLHMLNIRVSTKNSGKSAIYTVPVLKMGTGSFSKLQCWLDDDMDHIQYVTGSAYGNGINFLDDLDFGYAAPGMHYLHYRTIGNDGKPSSGIGEEPILVKSLYNTDGGEATVFGVGLGVDGGALKTFEVPHKQYETDYTYLLDTKNLSAGTHQLRAVVWNSIGAANVATKSFTVTGETTPEIVLSTEVVNGKVKLSFQPAPNDYENTIERIDANGARSIIMTTPQGMYPNTIIEYDQPADGTYKYVAKSKYVDFRGRNREVASAQISLAYAKPIEKPRVVDVMGYIEKDSYTPASGLTVKLSDDYLAVVKGDGSFLLKSVPIGMSFTPEVLGDNNHDYTLSAITIKEKNAALVLKGQLKESIQQDNLSNHLSLSNYLDWSNPHSVTFEIKNLSNKTWKGYVRAKAVPHSIWKSNSEENMEKLSVEDNVRLLPSGDDIERVELKAYEHKNITIQVDMLSKNKDKAWDFYFESVGNWDNLADEVRPLLIEDYLSEYHGKNLFKHTIAKNLLITDDNHVLTEDEKEKLARIIIGLSSQIDGLNGQGGDLSHFDEIIKKNEGNNVDNLMNQLPDFSLIDIFDRTSLKLLYENFVDPYIDPAIKRLHSVYNNKITASMKVSSDAYHIFSDIKAAYNYMKAEKEHDKYFVVAEWIADKATFYNPLYGNVLRTYVTLSKSIIEKALELGKTIYDGELVSSLRENQYYLPSVEEGRAKYRRINRWVDFRIRVKKGSKKKYFTPQEVKDQITEAWIIGESEGQSRTSKYACDMVVVDKNETDEVLLENKDYVMLKQIDEGSGNLADADVLDLFVELHWRNGTITKIPLVDEGNIDFDRGGPANPMYPEYSKPACYTITLKSAQTEDASHMADEMEL